MNALSYTLCLTFTLCAFVPTAQGQGIGKPEVVDPVARKYKPELDRLKAEYDAKLKAVQARMIADYDAAIRSSMGTKDLDTANALKSKMDALKDQSSADLRIVGKWNIIHGTKSDVWTINRDHTYSYGTDTGKWTYANGKYQFKHTWDWELRMIDENTFEGVCTRGQTGTKVSGTRAGL